MTDPVFRALVAIGAAESPALSPYCHSCHSNIGTASGRFANEDPGFEPLVMEGVTCESCHRVSGIRRPSAGGHILDPDAPMQGTSLAGNRSPYHATERSGVLGTPELCASCHDVESPDGLILEQPYAEWQSSPANDQGLTCKECHMTPDYGPAAQGFSLPDRPLRDHSFLGPGAVVRSEAPSSEDSSGAFAEVQTQLSGAVTIEVNTPAEAAPDSRIDVRITIESQISGHRFPTGSNFFRQIWVSVRVLDADGRLAYLCDPLDARASSCESEADQLYLSAHLMDEQGERTFLPWRAVRLDSNALAPLERRSIDVAASVPADAIGPLRVDATIQFQTFPLDLLRQLELSPDHAVLFQLGSAFAQVRVLPRSGP